MKTRNGISYQTRVTVYLDGKPIGEIREVEHPRSVYPGFAYFPKGQKDGGDVFPTVEACKTSLEAEPAAPVWSDL